MLIIFTDNDCSDKRPNYEYGRLFGTGP